MVYSVADPIERMVLKEKNMLFETTVARGLYHIAPNSKQQTLFSHFFPCTYITLSFRKDEESLIG